MEKKKKLGRKAVGERVTTYDMFEEGRKEGGGRVWIKSSGDWSGNPGRMLCIIHMYSVWEITNKPPPTDDQPAVNYGCLLKKSCMYM